jgi:threonine dehydrogenase-like Zn-dependent dehydrogenase
LTGLTVPGAFAEFISVDQRYCWPLASLRDAYPDEQSMYEVGALIEPLGCAYNGLFIAGGGFAPGAVVAIHGAGPIGLSAIMLARAAGASKVLAFDVSAGRLDLARRLGVDLAADPAQLQANGTTVHEFIRQETRGHGADMQVEAAGAADETVPQMIASAAANGKMIYLGRAANSAQIDFNTMVSGATQITGSRGHSGHGIYPSIIRLLAAGRLPAHQMITRRFSLDRVIEALALSKDAGEGKVMVGGRMGNQNDETRNQNENLEI